jgi:GT2 family glycosyltransferase
MAVSPGPRVQAVLVTHDGAPLIRRALAALAAQDHPDLDIVAVDNASTDGTAQILVELLGPERVVLSDQDVGLPAGVDLGLDALDARDAARGIERRDDDLVLIVHDDLVLLRDTVATLVSALRCDPDVAIVGPKLRWLDDPERLQSVGMTIDLTGRVDDAAWREICAAAEVSFRRGLFAQGALAMLGRIGELAARHFPPHAADDDELPNLPLIL